MNLFSTNILLVIALLLISACGPHGFQSKGETGIVSGLEAGLSEVLPGTPVSTPSENLKGFIANRQALV